MTNKQRKMFYLDETKNKIVSAGGVIIYRFVDGILELLMVKSRGVYEDFGGVVDMEDSNIFDTVSREAYEESNNLIDKDLLKERLHDSPSVYIPHCKYVVYFVEANDSEKSLRSSDFGDTEIHDNISRTVKWMPASEILKSAMIAHGLNKRLRYKYVFDEIKKIQFDRQLNVNMMID